MSVWPVAELFEKNNLNNQHNIGPQDKTVEDVERPTFNVKPVLSQQSRISTGNILG